MNAERQAIEAQVLEEALAQVDARLSASRANALPPLILAQAPGWHPGVIGIVASRLKDKYDRPSMVLAFDSKGEGKGSGRSIQGVDLGRAVTAALEAGLIVNGGGHAMAAGVTLTEDKLEAFEDFLMKRLEDAVSAASEAKALRLDGALSVRGATRDLYDLVQQARPYGAGNAEPRFAVPSVRVVKADIVGKAHVRCILTGEDGGRLKAIAFRAAGTPLGQTLMDRGSGLLHVAGAAHGRRLARKTRRAADAGGCRSDSRRDYPENPVENPGFSAGFRGVASRAPAPYKARSWPVCPASACALRLSVRTPDFHSGKRGSTPLGRTTSPAGRAFGSVISEIGLAARQDVALALRLAALVAACEVAMRL